MARHETRTEAAKAWRRDRSRCVQEIRFIQWEVEDAVLTELAKKYGEIEAAGGVPSDLILDSQAIRELIVDNTTNLLTDGSS